MLRTQNTIPRCRGHLRGPKSVTFQRSGCSIQLPRRRDSVVIENAYSSYHTVIVTVGTLPVSCAVDAVLTANIFAVAGMLPRNEKTNGPFR
jgi:hypothetical protein